MKVSGVSSTGNQSFRAGRVRVFSDFDKTFLPTSQDRFKECQDRVYINKLKAYFKSFESFFNKTRKGLKFSITTGRKFEEFLQFAEIARDKKVRMPLPDTLIVKNGTHEHLRVGSDKEFYRGGNFPFRYDIRNNEKERKIRNIPDRSNITKQVDTQEAVKRAVENNDLVIAAGDHYNDTEMLNPGLYLKDFLTQEMLNKYKNKDFSQILQKPDELIKLLDADSNLANIFKEIPFVGIIVKHKNGENMLSQLEPFTQGVHQKLILVEQGKLKEGIKEAIKLYNKQNPKFAKDLSKDLRKQINSSSGSDDDGNTFSKIWKYVAGGIVLLLVNYMYWNYKKHQNNKNSYVEA